MGPRARVLGVNMQPCFDWLVSAPPLISLATGRARAPPALRACSKLTGRSADCAGSILGGQDWPSAAQRVSTRLAVPVCSAPPAPAWPQPSLMNLTQPGPTAPTPGKPTKHHHLAPPRQPSVHCNPNHRFLGAQLIPSRPRNPYKHTKQRRRTRRKQTATRTPPMSDYYPPPSPSPSP